MIERKQQGRKKQLLYKGKYVTNIFKNIVEYKNGDGNEFEKVEIFVETDQEVALIHKYIQNEIYQENLIKLLKKNHGKSYDFYTDRSLVNRGIENVKMETGFIQT